MWGTTWGNLKNIKHLGNAHTGESTVPNRFFVKGLTNHSPEGLGQGETRDNSLGVVQGWGRGAAATVKRYRSPCTAHKSLKSLDKGQKTPSPSGHRCGYMVHREKKERNIFPVEHSGKYPGIIAEFLSGSLPRSSNIAASRDGVEHKQERAPPLSPLLHSKRLTGLEKQVTNGILLLGPGKSVEQDPHRSASTKTGPAMRM